MLQWLNAALDDVNDKDIEWPNAIYKFSTEMIKKSGGIL
jgi:hypothetical protein